MRPIESIIIRYYANSASLIFQGKKGESFANVLIQKLSSMHPNSEGKAIVEDEVEDRPSEPERAEELQNLYNVSINDQFQDIFTFHEGILTGSIS